MATIGEGDRIVLIDRRLFKDDNTRIFVGIVEQTEGVLVRARGFVFHVSSYEVAGQERRGEERVRVFSMGSGDIVYLLPQGPGHLAPDAQALAQVDDAERRPIRDGPERLPAPRVAAC